MENFTKLLGPGFSWLWADDKHIVRVVDLSQLDPATPVAIHYREIAATDYKDRCGGGGAGAAMYASYVCRQLKLPPQATYPAYIDLDAGFDERPAMCPNPLDVLTLPDVLEGIYLGLRTDLYLSFALYIDEQIDRPPTGAVSPVLYGAMLWAIKYEFEHFLRAPEDAAGENHPEVELKVSADSTN